jgi:rSAM/selenodomain-associated transferase 1
MRTEVVVFGRVPAPGAVKTRLAAEVGPMVAAQIYRVLLNHTLHEAVVSGFPVTLSLAEAPGAVTSWTPPPNIAVEVQKPGDLGERMADCFSAHFAARAGVVVLIGSDAPRMEAALVKRAARIAEWGQVALGPTFDGGYILVAQSAPGVAMFEEVSWSSPNTLAATRERLRALGKSCEELPLIADVDTLADVRALLADAEVESELRAKVMAAMSSRRGELA